MYNILEIKNLSVVFSIDKKVFFIFLIKFIFFIVIFFSLIKIKLGILKIRNHNPIKGPIILICSNFSLSKLRNGLSGFIKSIKQIINDKIPPKYPSDQAMPDIFPILFLFDTFFNSAL